jgi:hypothetical protein
VCKGKCIFYYVKGCAKKKLKKSEKENEETEGQTGKRRNNTNLSPL